MGAFDTVEYVCIKYNFQIRPYKEEKYWCLTMRAPIKFQVLDLVTRKIFSLNTKKVFYIQDSKKDSKKDKINQSVVGIFSEKFTL